ncbi:MAG: esterase family protein [Myxococcota bacterium]|nr:esterase family protein [Myxococcota bacterium]
MLRAFSTCCAVTGDCRAGRIPHVPLAHALRGAGSGWGWAFALLLAAGAAACGGDDPPRRFVDAGPDAEEECRARPALRFEPAEVGTVPGRTRVAALLLSRDNPCVDMDVELTLEDSSVVALEPSRLRIERNTSRAEVRLRGLGTGRTRLTARWQPPTGDPSPVTATLDVVVTADELPPCSGMASGRVTPGGELRVADGSLAGAFVALTPNSARRDRYHVEPFDASIGCAPDQVPDGWLPLGPAVRFGPVHLRFAREVPMAIPVRRTRLPEGAHDGHVELTYTGPGVPTPRRVPVAFVQWTGGPDGRLVFEAPRLGTYQAVVRADAGRPRMRRMTFRGITGISMGGGGTGIAGLRNLDRFDFLAPLGAAWDWQYMLQYMRDYHLGGFCTDEERRRDPASCEAGASLARVPPPRYMHEHAQHFEDWYYVDEHDGQGGRFDRREYVTIFRDLARMFGNPNTDRAATEDEPNVLPPGVPASELTRPSSQRCREPVIIPPYSGAPGTGFFDDEYNPEGRHPVIAFCDGAERVVGGERDVGRWDPAGPNDTPVEVALAVDVNANGRRDPGEPVIRNGREPWDDCGVDRVCNRDERGYDPITNPDPAGDDFDYQYNPTGTEGDLIRNGDPCNPADGEAFLDVGLDGVLGTRQLADGGFDRGEGNGCWDMAHGARRMLARGPRELIRAAPLVALQNLDVFADGGIRDLFLGATASNFMVSALVARGLPVRYYNRHGSLHLDGRRSDEEFVFTDVFWHGVGKYVLVRYGDPDAAEADIQMGDGAHVGTIVQAVNRLLAPLSWMSARWPGGDRRRVTDRLCESGRPDCPNPSQILFEFTASTGRTGPVTIILPPGYHLEEFRDQRYPVVVFLHGYGMEPADLLPTGILFWNYMTSTAIAEHARFQKMIFVFPDGRCRGEECLKGTFYTDAPRGTPSGAQMETFLLELLDYVDENYRTRRPEMVSWID